MSSLYTGGAAGKRRRNVDKQTTGGPAVIVDPEIAASAFLWTWQTELRPEGRAVRTQQGWAEMSEKALIHLWETALGAL